MPRDGSGNYSLPVGNPVVSNTVIASSWANDTMSDIATQLNNVLTRDGILGPTLPFKLVDGNVNAPGLGFNSEPGLGIYRINTSILGFSAAGKQIEVLDASTAATYKHDLYPRSVGSSEIRFNTDIYGEANTTVLQIGQNATGGYLTSLGVGTGVAEPITHTALEHRFYGTPRVLATAGNDSRMDIDRITSTTDTASLFWTTNGSKRFEAILFANDETGNAGGLQFNRYLNDGTTSEFVLSMSRSDGVTSIGRRLDLGGLQSGGETSLIVTRNSQFGGTVNITNSGSAINASAGSITADQGFIWPADGPVGLTSTSFSLSGSTRLNMPIDLNSGLAIAMNQQGLHNPGVDARWRFNVSTQNFDMLNSGTGQSLGGWVATSDKRLKTNSVPIENALEKVATLNGYTFDREDMAGLDGVVPRKAGYYAQEIQAVLPEAVLVADDEMGTLSVDHNGVIGLLIEAVKELNARTLVH
jgi:hypothetical protein